MVSCQCLFRWPSSFLLFLLPVSPPTTSLTITKRWNRFFSVSLVLGKDSVLNRRGSLGSFAIFLSEIKISLILKSVCQFKNMIMMLFYRFRLHCFGGSRVYFPCCHPQRESLISLRRSHSSTCTRCLMFKVTALECPKMIPMGSHFSF